MELILRYQFCAAAMHIQVGAPAVCQFLRSRSSHSIGAPPEQRLKSSRISAPAITAPLPALDLLIWLQHVKTCPYLHVQGHACCSDVRYWGRQLIERSPQLLLDCEEHSIVIISSCTHVKFVHFVQSGIFFKRTVMRFVQRVGQCLGIPNSIYCMPSS